MLSATPGTPGHQQFGDIINTDADLQIRLLSVLSSHPAPHLSKDGRQQLAVGGGCFKYEMRAKGKQDRVVARG